MVYTFKPQGVCSNQIVMALDGNIIKEVAFSGGCSGNLQGICRLLQEMPVEEAISRLQGIRCGFKNTSCPDQLAGALRLALSKEMEHKNAQNP